MKKKRVGAGMLAYVFHCVSIAIALFYSSPVWASDTEIRFRIWIPLEVGEAVQVLSHGAKVELGTVQNIPKKSKYPSFTASRHGVGGQVVATAANAHHLLLLVRERGGETISLLPLESFAPTSSYGTSFAIEGKGGVGLWGEYAPTVGSSVFVVYPDKSRVPFTDFSYLDSGIALEIEVPDRQNDMPYLEIENREGGLVWYDDPDGKQVPIATVVRPVRGTGRFTGTLYEGVGFIRANHPGVICVSTSPRGVIGGFQIIPVSHSHSQEMKHTELMGQYLVLKGFNGQDLAGSFPLFNGVIRPGDESVTERNEGKVLAKIGGNWYSFPEMASWTEESLTHIESIRILLQ